MSYNLNLERKKNYKFNTIKNRKILLPLISRIIVYIFLITLSIIILAPFYFMIVNATRNNNDISQVFSFLPGDEFFNNFSRLTKIIHVFTGFKNSLIVSISATLLSAYFGSLAAFGLAKYRFSGKKHLFTIVLASLIIPQQISIVGFIKVCSMFNIKDSLLPLIIPAIASSGVVFFLKFYIESAISDSIMDSARVEGCTEFTIFNRIVLPVIIPAIVTMSIFTFISNWNNLFIPLLVLENQDLYTLPIFTYFTKGIYGNDYGAIYSGIAVSVVPILIVYPFCTKYIIRGLTVGMMKE